MRRLKSFIAEEKEPKSFNKPYLPEESFDDGHRLFNRCAVQAEIAK
jgi:hypothetical protein